MEYFNARYPRFSNDGKKIAYLTTEQVGFHNTCSKLIIMDWETKKSRVAVDIVLENEEGKFPGLFASTLVSNCWSNDNIHIFCDTAWRCRSSLVKINTETGTVSKIDPPGDYSCMLLDFKNDRALVACSCPILPHSSYIYDSNANRWIEVELLVNVIQCRLFLLFSI